MLVYVEGLAESWDDGSNDIYLGSVFNWTYSYWIITFSFIIFLKVSPTQTKDKNSELSYKNQS